jgi:putative tryptophan/tyrosine transport system substrate-binding protein
MEAARTKGGPLMNGSTNFGATPLGGHGQARTADHRRSQHSPGEICAMANSPRNQRVASKLWFSSRATNRGRGSAAATLASAEFSATGRSGSGPAPACASSGWPDLESDPIAKGYVKTIARPGGNLTGMFLDLPELSGKQIGLLKEIAPRLSRIAVFGIPGLNEAQFAATATVVRALALEAEIMEVRNADDFEGALEAVRIKHVEAGILLSSPLVFISSKQIGEIAIAKRLPLISLFAEFPKQGGLISYGPNVAELYRRCGDYVAKILHGVKPSDLPIQRPEKFDLVINLKTAAALGLDVPTQLQQLADEVIE